MGQVAKIGRSGICFVDPPQPPNTCNLLHVAPCYVPSGHFPRIGVPLKPPKQFTAILFVGSLFKGTSQTTLNPKQILNPNFVKLPTCIGVLISWQCKKAGDCLAFLLALRSFVAWHVGF